METESQLIEDIIPGLSSQGHSTVDMSYITQLQSERDNTVKLFIPNPHTVMVAFGERSFFVVNNHKDVTVNPFWMTHPIYRKRFSYVPRFKQPYQAIAPLKTRIFCGN